jgi:DNA-binding MarR family transcriptional regulator
MSSTVNRARRKSSREDRRAALESEALLAARALVDRMRSLYRELERLTDAPITLHRALVCIGNQPGLPASELARQLGMKKPAMSQALKSLAARGWIERRRHDGDQRSVQIHVTAAGEKILKATAGRAVVTLQRAVRNLPSGDLTRLGRGLRSLLCQLPDLSAPTVIAKRRTTAR